jgi:hypothetical protein
MAQFKGVNNANSAPGYVASSLSLGSGKANRKANNAALFNNTSSGAFISGKTVSVVGVETAAKANTSGEGSKVSHPGWQLRTEGSGGRAGRVHYECLVAMGSMATGAGSNTASLPIGDGASANTP